jgi:hypothetical protein
MPLAQHLVPCRFAIDAVVFVPAFGDVGTICEEFALGVQTTWLAWQAAITATLSDLRTAINGSPSPGAVIIYTPKALNVDFATGSDTEYWSYFTPQNMLNCLVLDPYFAPGGNSGGFQSAVNDFHRTTAATYNAVYQDYIYGRFREFLRYSEQTYNATHASDCGATQCTSSHLNNFAHKALGDDTYRLYLVAKGSTDTDSDGLADVYETNVSLTNPAVADTDGDGCNDGVELGGHEVFGGNRDPLNASDFFDTNGDKIIDGKDIAAMRSRVFQGKPSRAFSSLYRRSIPESWTWGQDPAKSDAWDTKSASSGQITSRDLALMSIQRTHRCNCLPDYSDCMLANGLPCQSDRQCLSNACGCGGGAASQRTCQAATVMTGHTADPRRCTNLAAYEMCIENGDCASNVCNDSAVKGIFQCVGN